MRVLWLAAVFAALVLSTQLLQAQQTDSSRSMGPGAKGMMMTPGQQMGPMASMDAMNARLDTLAGRMNRATGNAKVTFMAQVINEMVAQRKAMQAHMRAMMQSHPGMMGMGNQSSRTETARPKPTVDSAAADTAGHAGHHPEK